MRIGRNAANSTQEHWTYMSRPTNRWSPKAGKILGGLAVVVSDRRNDADSPGMSSVTRVLSLFLATKSRSQTDWQSGGSEHDLVARQFERVWAWSAENQHYGQQGSDQGNNDDDRGERSVCLAASSIEGRGAHRPDTPDNWGLSFGTGIVPSRISRTSDAPSLPYDRY